MDILDKIINYISKYINEIAKIETQINNKDISPKKEITPERYREFNLYTYF